MWIRTHYFMAKSIHSYIKEKYKVSLQLDQLQYGSIKPDLLPKYWEGSHYYESCSGTWLAEVAQLLGEQKKRSIRNFSDKLGVILHFTADFFCSAHNLPNLRENMWEHLLYELKLDVAFRHFESFRGIQCLNYDDPYDLLTCCRQDYLSGQPSLERDIHYIYAVSLSITDLLVTQALLPVAKPLMLLKDLPESS